MASTCIAVLMTCVVLTPFSSPAEMRDSIELFNEMCDVLIEEPSFYPPLLFDVWVNDFSWNTRQMPFDLLVFTNVTIQEIRQYKRDMGRLLVSQPVWNTAVAIMINQQQSRRQQKMMLFPEGRKPGRFVGVPNFREVNPVVYIKKKSVFLVRLQMLMIANATYLIVMDCDTGETSLSHRDTLEPIYAPPVYMAAFRVPFPVRYSHLYTGVVIPDIMADHPMEPLFA